MAEGNKILFLVLDPRSTMWWEDVDEDASAGEQTSAPNVVGTKTSARDESWFFNSLVLEPRITEPTAAVAERAGRVRCR